MGQGDESVKVEEAHALKAHIPHAKLTVLEGVDHAFDGAHPWEEPNLPEAFIEVLENTIAFIRGLIENKKNIPTGISSNSFWYCRTCFIISRHSDYRCHPNRYGCWYGSCWNGSVNNNNDSLGVGSN